MLHFPTSSDISIEVNGQKLAVAQSFRARTSRESRYVEAFGSVEPAGTVGGRVKHLIDLTRVSALSDGVGDQVNFHDLTDFNVVITRPDRKIIYAGCEWADIDESASLGNVVLESVSIVASRRIEL